jgi:hypothetical protein
VPHNRFEDGRLLLDHPKNRFQVLAGLGSGYYAMVLTKRKHNWSDTDLALQETTTNHERSKLEEVTGELEHELKIVQAKTKQV